MLYYSPDPGSGGGGGSADRGHASAPETDRQRGDRLQKEVRALQQSLERNGRTITQLNQSLLALQDGWENDRKELLAFGKNMQIRANDAERQQRISEVAQGDLEERLARLNGIEESLTSIARDLANLSQILGQGVKQAKFTNRTPTELASFITEQLEVVEQAVKALRERNDNLRNDRSAQAQELESANESLTTVRSNLEHTLERIGLLEQTVRDLREENVALHQEKLADPNMIVSAEVISASSDRVLDQIAAKSLVDRCSYFIELKDASVDERSNFHQAIRLSMQAPLFIQKILEEFESPIAAMEGDEALLESTEYQTMVDGKASFEELIAEYVNSYRDTDLILSLDADTAKDIVERLEDCVTLQLVGAYLANSERTHILGTTKLLHLIEHMPLQSRVALIELLEDPAEQLALVFGTPSVRKGVAPLAKNIKVLDADPLKAARYINGMSKQPDFCEFKDQFHSAREALKILEYLRPETLKQLLTIFGSQDGLKEAHQILGFRLPYALCFAGRKVRNSDTR